MNKSSTIVIILFIILTSMLIEFFNYKIKLEKPDEDWAWKNTSELHLTDKTLIENSSKSKLELIFFSSNNYFYFNYYVIKFFNKSLSYVNEIINIKKLGYKNIFLNNKLENKIIKKNLDNKNYSKKYLESEYKFANNEYIFEDKKSNFFYHYNYIYLNNIILFLIIIFLIFKINYKYLYPTLIYFLTPQINSFILFINSDYLIILFTPIIYILFKEKKIQYIFVILFCLQLFNRSNIFFLILFSHFIYFNYDFLKIKLKYKIIFYMFIFVIINFLIYYFLEDFNSFNLFINSSIFYIFDNNFNLFFYTILKSLLVFFISHIYLNGQNSFILSYYDYIVFTSFIIFYLTYSFLFFKNNLIYNALLVFLITIFYMNGFDQFRHHTLIYTILIFQFFSYNMNKINSIRYVNFSYICFLIYVNIKSSYLEFFIF